jgi:hypothetical protein
MQMKTTGFVLAAMLTAVIMFGTLVAESNAGMSEVTSSAAARAF